MALAWMIRGLVLNGGGDLPDIVEKWNARKEQTENKLNSKFFYIDKKEIEESDYDLNIKHYKVADHEDVISEKSTEILERIDKVENEILRGIESLRKI